MSDTASTASDRVPPRPGRSCPTTSTASPSIRDAVADAVSGRGQKENCVPDVVDPLFPPIDWEVRLQAALTETMRKRAARAAAKRELDARRQVGLQARHAAKLARNAMTTGIDMSDQTRMAIDAAELTSRELHDISRTLTRAASASSVSPNVAIALGLLADQASRLARTKTIGDER